MSLAAPIGSSGPAPVRKLVAGTGVTLSPASGEGVVTISSSGGSVNLDSYATGYWYGDYPATGSGISSAKGRIYFSKFTVKAATFSATAIGAEVTAKVTTTVLRLGIYGDSGHGQPKAKVLDAGTVASATNGLKQIAVSETLSQGVYWLAVVRQGVPAGGTLKLNQITFTWTLERLGFATPTLPEPPSLVGWFSTATTFTGALPATAPALTAVVGSGAAFPAVFVKSA